MYQIKVSYKSKGDSRRGYHNGDTTVEFEYEAGKSYLNKEREMEVVDFLVGTFFMWKSYTKVEEYFTTEDYHGHQRRVKTGATYVVNHGYDSGD